MKTWVVGQLVGETWVVGPLVGETWVGVWAMGLASCVLYYSIYPWDHVPGTRIT